MFFRRRRERRYAELLKECLERQPVHEREHALAHPSGGAFTPALQVEAVARRFERKIHLAGLPALSPDERRARTRKALCPSPG